MSAASSPSSAYKRILASCPSAPAILNSAAPEEGEISKFVEGLAVPMPTLLADESTTKVPLSQLK